MKEPKYPYNLQEKDLFCIIDHMHDYDSVQCDLLYDSHIVDSEPLISIVIPVYNAELFESAYESAVSQTFNLPYEIVICHNDPTPTNDLSNIIKRHDKGNTRYYKNRENIGVFGNWNRLVSLARANYLTFLHADDMLVNDTLEKLWGTHTSLNPKIGIIGRYMGIDKNGEIKYIQGNNRLKGLLKAKKGYNISHIGLLFGDMCNGCGSLLNKKCIIELGGWNNDFLYFADRVLMLNYADRFGLYRLNEIVRKETTFLSTSNNLWQNFPSSGYYQRKAVINRYLSYKWLWNFYSKHAYINQLYSYSGFMGDDPNKKPPFFSHYITALFKFVYRMHDAKLF